jgi:hypothetical protein
MKSKPAKSVIEIWLGGGPSQLETFDPKPDAPREVNNGMKAIPTNASFKVHEWLPKLAQCADLYSVVRTLTHPHGGHETAAYLMQTGRNPGGGVVYPALGAMISSMKRKNYQGDLPPFVILTQGKGRFSEIGFLGEEHAPLVTGGNPASARFVVDGIVPPGGITNEELDRRFELAARLDRLPHDAAFDAAGAAARKIITGTAAQTFDLALESNETRDRYGRNVFGQSLLAARRLVEYGVPYISVNYMGIWDSHKRHFETIKRPTADVDAAVSALLTDLKARNLLDDTIVWMTGEFGRTTKIDMDPTWQGGRHHFPRCFSALVAGGGFKGGVAVGKSDDTAANVKDRPVTPADFLGSICELAGINPDDHLPNGKGFELPVLPPASEIGRLKEIYA